MREVEDIINVASIRKCRENYESGFGARFERLKRQCEEIKESGYRWIDVEMIPYLEFINSIPDVATTWCCSGHYEEVKGRSILASTNSNRRHVSFVLRHAGYHPLLEAIEDCMRTIDPTFNKKIKVVLKQVALRWKFLAEEGDTENPMYVAYFLELIPAQISTVKEYEDLTNGFLEGLKNRYEEIMKKRWESVVRK